MNGEIKFARMTLPSFVSAQNVAYIAVSASARDETNRDNALIKAFILVEVTAIISKQITFDYFKLLIPLVS